MTTIFPNAPARPYIGDYTDSSVEAISIKSALAAGFESLEELRVQVQHEVDCNRCVFLFEDENYIIIRWCDDANLVIEVLNYDTVSFPFRATPIDEVSP